MELYSVMHASRGMTFRAFRSMPSLDEILLAIWSICGHSTRGMGYLMVTPVLDSGLSSPSLSAGGGQILFSYARHFTLTVPLSTQE